MCVRFAIICIFLLCLAVALYIQSTERPETIAELHSYWKQRITAVGGVSGYKEFGQSVARLPEALQHTRAHVFGEELYAIEGTSSMSVCDGQFTNGCLHGFLSAMIADHGIAQTIPILDAACQLRNMTILGGSCKHAIGHGIMANLGYKTSDLNTALGLCTQYTTGNLSIGCWSGAFMEYNIRTFLRPDVSFQPLTSQNVYGACEKLPDVYKPACVFALPWWWRVALTGVLEEHAAFARMGSYCDALNNSLLARACYEGIGDMAPFAGNADIAHTASLCAASSDDVHNGLLCWGQVLRQLNDKGSRGDPLCVGFSGVAATYCAEHDHERARAFSG